MVIPEEYPHACTLSNTAKEHNKNATIQLEMAKKTINAYFETKVKVKTARDDGTMMYICAIPDKHRSKRANP